MTISAAGFGHRIGWEDDEIPPGHKMGFKRAVEIIGTGIFVKLLCPNWIFQWAPIEVVREARDGFAEYRVSPLYELYDSSVAELMQRIQSYLAEMINERKLSNEKDGKRDLLSNLVDANEDFLDDGEQRLGEEELIGKRSTLDPATHPFTKSPLRKHFRLLPCWIRGKDSPACADSHLISVVRKSSGHSLCFALNMLAVHQEEQEALYQHIQEILPGGRLPVSAQGLYR